MTNITPIVEFVIALLCTIITYAIIPYIKSKTTIAQQQEILECVTIAVTAAEQIYKGTGRGKEKKAYVMQWLKDRGFEVDEAKIDAMIESAVHQMNASVQITEVTKED